MGTVFARLAKWLKEDLLSSGKGIGEAADILWSLVSIRCYEGLVIHRGWTPQRWVRWVRRVLRRELLGQRAT